ncbi:MAG: histidine kinase [Oscillospiraceae bacterium]
MKPMLKFQKKLFLTYSALLIVILITFTTIILYVLYSQYQNSIEESQQQITYKTAQQIDTSIYEMDKSVSSLIFNKEFRKIVQSREKQIENYRENNIKILDTFVTLDAPLFEMYRLIAFNKYTYYTFVKSGEDKDFITNKKNNYPWEKELLALGGSKMIIPPHNDTFSTNKVPVYSVARNISDKDGYVLATIEIQHKYEKLVEICKIDEGVGKILVFSDQGELVYPFDSKQSGNTTEYSELYNEISLAATKADGHVEYNGSNIFYNKSKYCHWTTVLIPNNSITKLVSTQLIFYILAAFMILCGLMLFVLRISTSKMTKPLAELNNSIRHVSFNNMSLKLSDTYGLDEISFINQSFEKMFIELQQSIAKSVQSKANEERANYLALEAQMNPHTIYNTISMIESVSYMNGDKEVSSLCIHFSQMLRYISDYTKKDYSIHDEVQHLYNYATLTEKRYEGKLKISVSCDETLLDTPIPKFTLQPFVENSIKHGLSRSITLLQINATVSKLKNGWTIRVKDNGIGFTHKKLKEIEQQLSICDDSLKNGLEIINMKIGNLALSNIYIRFKIMYGNRFHMNIFNNPDSDGCTIELVIDQEKLGEIE